MKFFKLFSCILALIVMLSLSATGEASKKTVALMDIACDSHTKLGPAAADQLNVEIESAIVSSGAYNVLERQRLATCLSELGFQQTGVVDGETAIELGNMTGAQYSIMGSVVSAEITATQSFLYTAIKAKIRMNFKFVDNATGNVTISQMVEGTKTVSNYETGGTIPEASLIHAAAVDVAEKISDLVIGNQEGTIAALEGKVAYIDLGKENGVKVGNVFTIFKEGKPIYHPIKKTIIGMTSIPLGTLKITEVADDYAAGSYHMDDGNKIAQGMKVKKVMKK